MHASLSINFLTLKRFLFELKVTNFYVSSFWCNLMYVLRVFCPSSDSDTCKFPFKHFLCVFHVIWWVFEAHFSQLRVSFACVRHSFWKFLANASLRDKLACHSCMVVINVRRRHELSKCNRKNECGRNGMESIEWQGDFKINNLKITHTLEGWCCSVCFVNHASSENAPSLHPCFYYLNIIMQ